MKLGGSVTPYVLFRDGGLREAESGLNGGVVPVPRQTSAALATGQARLRLDVAYRKISAVIEIGTDNVDAGRFEGVGPDTTSDAPVSIQQAFLRVRDLLVEDVSLYLGIRDLRATGRFWGEPFFLDVTHSESAFDRFVGSGRALRNFVFRDSLEPVGALLRYDPMGPVRAEAFAYKISNGIGGSRPIGGDRVDEDLLGIYVDGFAHPEYTKGFLVFTDFRGGGDPTRPPAFNQIVRRGSDVFTAGGGVDLFFGEGKPIEVFGEGYGQFGRLTRGVEKRAYAFRAGTRLMTVLEGHSWFVEGIVWEASGDRNPADDHDDTFQSYENEQALAILQSQDYGLDIDTNYRGFRLTGGLLGLAIDKAGALDLSIDFGGARFVHRVRDDAGARFLPHELGYEIDLDVRWAYAPELSFFLTVATLFDSSVLSRISTDGTRSTWLVVFGGSFRY